MRCRDRSFRSWLLRRRCGSRSDRWPVVYLRILGRGEGLSLQFCAQYASIFRLLLKVAVSVTHQCAFSNFCKASCLYASRIPAPPIPIHPGRSRERVPPSPSSSPPPSPMPALSAPVSIRLAASDRICGQSKIGGLGFRVQCSPYLLSLLAMIKCSICSYQCDN